MLPTSSLSWVHLASGWPDGLGPLQAGAYTEEYSTETYGGPLLSGTHSSHVPSCVQV